MSAQNFRLPAGGRIDRSRSVRFTFDGRPCTGHPGDTLASALLANGVQLVARSFKYHRPRGIMGAGAEETNAFVQLGRAAAAEPNVNATRLELFDGLEARSVNCWPSVQHDFGAAADRLSAFLPAGFYYKTFMWPARAWRFYEHFIRRAAGIGSAPDGADPDRYEKRFDHYDIAVIGGGPAGLAAALAAGRSGARVLLADEQSEFGGRLLSDSEHIDGAAASGWLDRTVAELEAMPNVRLLTRTTATSYLDHNLLVLVERVTDHLGAAAPPHLPRQRLWKVRARQVVLATGALERPLVFANNDRPGIMLASAAQTYVTRYAVRPGRRVVAFTNNDSVYPVVRSLAQAGVIVAAVVDVRRDAGSLAHVAKEAGAQLLTGAVVADTRGASRIASVDVYRLDGDALGGPATTIDCDVLLMSGGWSPSLHLFCQSGGRTRFDSLKACLVPGDPAQEGVSAGAANGTFGLAGCLEEGMNAGVAAARRLGFAAPDGRAPQVVEAVPEQPLRPLWAVPVPRSRGKSFVDFQNDVTTGDLGLAVREGYRSIEHVKRYTTTGMGIDQGKAGNLNAAALVARLTGADLAQVGVTTFRPPYTPVTFGALAGRDAGSLFRPQRRLQLHNVHVAAGAAFEPVGLWSRPHHYPRPGESAEAAVARECLAVRRGVGISDNSTLGKIEFHGPDARAFLDLVYTNSWQRLAVGACRYGLMLHEDGMVFDDGVTSCLGEQHFFMTTTSGNADQVIHWLEEWKQCEWPALDVYLTPVTSAWATLNLAGPKARDVLRAAGTDIDLGAAAFPFMTVRSGRVAGLSARVFRVSFTGELSYEISVPARHARRLWDALMAAGAAHGITPFGTEAIHVLRAEKGFIAVGLETDGSVSPLDLGMGWIVGTKKKDFIGKRSLELAELRRPDRKQLVGLETRDPAVVLPLGAQIIGRATGATSTRSARPGGGYVTSSYFSPTLERSIAMALLESGRGRMGEEVEIVFDRGTARARVVGTRFYDPESVRLHA
jgi:sarcosine oxidase subunit alpha